MKRIVLLLSISILATLISGWVNLAKAQQPKRVPRIGLLWSISRSSVAPYNEAFRQGLRELGYIEGKNVIIEHRYRGRTTKRTAEVAAKQAE